MQRSAPLICHSVRRCLTALAVLVALPFCAQSLSAQDKKQKPADEPPPPLFVKENWGQRGATAFFGAGFGENSPLRQVIVLNLGHQLRFWDLQPPLLRGEIRTPVGAAAVVLSGLAGLPPVSGLAFLDCGDFSDCWSLEDSQGARDLNPNTLDAARDGLPLPDEEAPSPEAAQETFPFNVVLLKSIRAPVASFEKEALAQSPARLMEDPQHFRGRLARLNGRLKRVAVRPAPTPLKDNGIKRLYAVWIVTFGDGVPRQACLLTPYLPPGFKVGDLDDKGPMVTLAGYFFKKYRAPAGSGATGYPGRSVPLLVGHVFPSIGPILRGGLAAASVLGAGFTGLEEPLQQLNFLVAGDLARGYEIRDPLWIPPLTRANLDGVADETPLPPESEDLPEKKRKENDAYYEAVIQANKTSAEAFRKAARKDVTLVMLFNEPWRFRGEVVQVSGRLRRVREMPPMQMVRQEGVKQLYEVWLMNDEFSKPGNPNPVVLICTQLPPGIKVAEEVKDHVPVAFVGYFFKKYRYRSAEDAKKMTERDAPMIIGRLVYQPKEKVKPAGWMGLLLPIFFAVIMVTFALVFLLNWFFRRADRQIQTRVDAAASLFVNAPEPEHAETPPPGPLPETERGREEVLAPPPRLGEGAGGEGSPPATA
jgi:hypothetical protein